MWTLGSYSSDVLWPELWSYFKDKSPLFDVFVEVFERAKMSCSFSKQAPRNKEQFNPSRNLPDVHQTMSKRSEGAACTSFPECFGLEYHSSPQKQQKKKSPVSC